MIKSLANLLTATVLFFCLVAALMVLVGRGIWKSEVAAKSAEAPTDAGAQTVVASSDQTVPPPGPLTSVHDTIRTVERIIEAGQEFTEGLQKARETLTGGSEERVSQTRTAQASAQASAALKPDSAAKSKTPRGKAPPASGPGSEKQSAAASQPEENPERSQTEASAGPPAQPTAPEGSGTQPKPTPEHRIHVVSDGETLYGIARKYLEDGTRWPEIARANQIEDGGWIRVGQKLIVPLPAGNPTGASPTGAARDKTPNAATFTP